MVLAMKKEIEELNGEVRIYKAALSNGILCSRPKQQAMDVPKSEKFKGTRSAKDDGVVGPRMKNMVGTQLRLERSSKKEARAKLHHLMQQGIVREYVRVFSELMLQIYNLN
ncbi:hypothetical protein Gotur_006579 [Gossypium turneri]